MLFACGLVLKLCPIHRVCKWTLMHFLVLVALLLYSCGLMIQPGEIFTDHMLKMNTHCAQMQEFKGIPAVFDEILRLWQQH